MSAGWAIAIAAAGSIVLLGGIALMIRLINRPLRGGFERLRQEAPRRGWRYEEDGNAYVPIVQQGYDSRPNVATLTPHLPMLDGYEGRRHKVFKGRKVVTGTHRGRPFLAGEFRVRSPTEQGSETNWTWCVWVRMPAARPYLTVNKAIRLESRVRKHIGQGDLQLESEEFNEKFDIVSENNRFTYDFLNPRMMRFLLDDQRNLRGFNLQLDQFNINYQLPNYLDPKFLVPYLDACCDVLDLVPDFVWK